MPLSLNIGTIDIQDQEVAQFIRNKSIDEIKTMFTDFLTHQVKDASKSTKPTGKWGAFAKRMSGLTTPEVTEHIQQTRAEMKDNFELRSLNGK